MSELISFKELSGEPDEMGALQDLLNLVPDFTRRCRGEEQGPLTPAELLQQVPEGVKPENRVVYGIYFNHRMVGCMDVIKGHPDERTVLVGVLLIAEDVQGAGLGSEAFKELEKMVRGWEGFDRIRIGILRSNDFVQNFWRKMGFRKTGESQNYESGSLRTKIFYMDKSLRAGFSKSAGNNGPKRSKKNNGPRSNRHHNNNHNNNNSNNNQGQTSSTETAAPEETTKADAPAEE